MLEAQARGMGDQLTERDFPSARALSLRQAALRGPWEGLSGLQCWLGCGSHPFLQTRRPRRLGCQRRSGRQG